MPYLLADGIAPEGLLILGGLFFVLPATLVVLVEGIILWAVARLPFRRALGWSLVANVASGLAGVALLVLFAYLAPRMVAPDLHVYFVDYLGFSILRYIGYLALSVVVEYRVVLWLRRGMDPRVPAGRLLVAVVLGNLLTYAALSPLHYLATRPTHTFTALRADTSWSPDTTTPIFFLDPATGYLWRTTPVGRPRKILMAAPMTAYQLSPDLKVCVFLAPDRTLYYCRAEGGAMAGRFTAPLRVGQLAVNRHPDLSDISLVTLSPSGQRVAYGVPIEETATTKPVSGYDAVAYSLCVFDAGSGRSFTAANLFPGDQPPQLAWTTDESVLVARYYSPPPVSRTVQKEVILADSSAMLVDGPAVPLNPVFGTFGPTIEPAVFYRPAWDRSTSGDLDAQVIRVITREHLTIGPLNMAFQGGPIQIERFRLDDNPGIPFLSPGRQYEDVAFLPNSTLVLLTDGSNTALYLIDANTGVLGKIGPGKTAIVLSPKYQMAAHWLGKGALVWPASQP